MTAIAQPRRKRIHWRNGLTAAFFLAPFLILFVVFTLGPVLAAFILSFTQYDAIQPPRSIGLENYRQVSVRARRRPPSCSGSR
jgi:multiple sugar transport system permease protein